MLKITGGSEVIIHKSDRGNFMNHMVYVMLLIIRLV